MKKLYVYYKTAKLRLRMSRDKPNNILRHEILNHRTRCITYFLKITVMTRSWMSSSVGPQKKR